MRQPASFAELLDAYESKLARGELGRGLSLGFPKLDELLYGLDRDALAIITARTSVGKSAFALNVAANVAMRGDPVLYLSTEMSEEAVLRRLLGIVAGLPVMPLRAGETSLETISEAVDRHRELPLNVLAIGRATVDDVAATVATRPDAALVAVDYLGHLGDHENRNGHERIEAVSRKLQALARRPETPPILAVAQQNREASEGAPKLHTIRGSDALAHDADVILSLWDENTGPRDDARTLKLTILKNREGGGVYQDIDITFTASTQRMTEAESLDEIADEPSGAVAELDADDLPF